MNRLHSLPTGQADLDTFVLEGRDYLTGVAPQLSGVWEREGRLQRYRVSNSGALLSQPFGF